MFNARARCVSDCSMRGLGVSVTVFCARGLCVVDGVQFADEVCQ